MDNIDLTEVQAAYEALARKNRPDWDAFIAEAKNDPSDIAYEWCDTAVDLTGLNLTDEQVESLFKAARAWVAAL